MTGGLGRVAPPDWEHYEKYPLTAATTPTDPVPVAIGVNWYTNFDNPVYKSGRWWIGLDSKRLGSVRGGHCVCLEPGDSPSRTLQDINSWWDFYNQGAEGACVGFGSSRMMSLLNRKKYNAWWLWDLAKSVDQWTDTNPGDDNGTSVRAACQILANNGHVTWDKSQDSLTYQSRDRLAGSPAEGISVYRWANTVDQVRDVLKAPEQDKAGAVRILNSWGRDYPHRVWMPYATLDRLIQEDGEVALITDR
jgi:hypothetical protein